jgi:hypothetical protein
MRRTATLLAATALLAGVAVGCSSSDDAADCAAALTKWTGGDAGDKPTVEEAKERVEALDKNLAGMVAMGYETVAKDAHDTLERKTEEGGKGRPEACESLSEDDYTVLSMAKSMNALGWTDKDGQFDKLKMAKNLGN